MNLHPSGEKKEARPRATDVFISIWLQLRFSDLVSLSLIRLLFVSKNTMEKYVLPKLSVAPKIFFSTWLASGASPVGIF